MLFYLFFNSRFFLNGFFWGREQLQGYWGPRHRGSIQSVPLGIPRFIGKTQKQTLKKMIYKLSKGTQKRAPNLLQHLSPPGWMEMSEGGGWTRRGGQGSNFSDGHDYLPDCLGCNSQNTCTLFLVFFTQHRQSLGKITRGGDHPRVFISPPASPRNIIIYTELHDSALPKGDGSHFLI